MTTGRLPRVSASPTSAERNSARAKARGAVIAAVVLATGALVVTACGGGEASQGEDSGRTGTITVSAASSLTDAFDQIARDFSEANPGIEVELNFASSATLARQIDEGAPADVFASADDRTMTSLVEDDLIDGEVVVFARNDVTIVVPPGNPDGVRTLADLQRLNTVAVCTEDAPCGRLADEALQRADVDLPDERVTRAPNARATLAAVTEGDADAAIVFSTDAAAAGTLATTVAIPAEHNVTTDYVIAVVASTETTIARSFIAWVTGSEGREVLRQQGFTLP